jgi:hypothetical protein
MMGSRAASTRCHSFQALLAAMALLLAVGTALRGDALVPYPKTQLLATLQDREVDESSGIMLAGGRVAAEDELFWTHNDSGDGPYLYLFDRKGANRGTWLIAGATNVDAEDCAAGPGPAKGQRYLYFGDIGDNESKRTDCVVWRVPEPAASTASPATERGRAATTVRAEGLPFAYPDGPHDCESLLVHPVTGDIYLVTKERAKATSGVYKFSSSQGSGMRQTLRKIGEVRLGSYFPLGSSLVTAGDIAPDGKRLVLRDYTRVYEFTLPEDATSFDEIWKQAPRAFAAPPMLQGESICYGSEGRSLYLTSEQLPTPLYEMGP